MVRERNRNITNPLPEKGMIDWLPPFSSVHLVPVSSHTPAGWRQAALWDSEPSSSHPAGSRWEVLGRATQASSQHFIYAHRREMSAQDFQGIASPFCLGSLGLPLQLNDWCLKLLLSWKDLIWALVTWAAEWDGRDEGMNFSQCSSQRLLGEQPEIRSYDGHLVQPPASWHRRSTLCLGAEGGD